jgi:hypothetical protein
MVSFRGKEDGAEGGAARGRGGRGSGRERGRLVRRAGGLVQGALPVLKSLGKKGF